MMDLEREQGGRESVSKKKKKIAES